jgi:hypothetical protein
VRGLPPTQKSLRCEEAGSLALRRSWHRMYLRRPGLDKTSEVSPDTGSVLKRLDHIDLALDAIAETVGAKPSPGYVQLSASLDASPRPPGLRGAFLGTTRSNCKMPNLLTFKLPYPTTSPWSYDCTDHFFSIRWSAQKPCSRLS